MHINYIPEEDKIIREMAAAGKTPAQIAQVLTTRTKDSITTHCYRRGIELTVYKPEIDFDAFKRIMKAGKQKCL